MGDGEGNTASPGHDTASDDGRTADGRRRPKVSGVVTCFNEEHNIAACIESMLWCDEIVVVDSHSTDRTPEIATSYDKVRFFQREYYGAGAQKNWALRHVTHDWVFLLDADERCTPELKDELEDLLARGPEHAAYTINRDVYFLGRRIRYSGWQHDRVARLFRRGAAYYENRRVHSLLHTNGEAPLLRRSIEHHMVDRSFDEYAFRIARYGYWGAAQCWRDGTRCSALAVALRPLWRFIRTYVLQRGFLDGARGLVFCVLQSYGTYMKFAILWGWQVNHARGIEPQLPDFDEDDRTWEGLQRIVGRESEERAAEAEPVR
jgi:glycosyltransferase involved in cell wall biosynthesis